MTNWTELIVKADTPNANGVIYTRESLERAFSKYMERNDRFGCVGETILQATDCTVPFDKVSHSLERVYWEGNNLYGTIKIFPTACGKALLDIICHHSEELTLGLSCRGRMDKHVSSIDLFDGEENIFASDLDVVTICVLEKSLTNH